jgi:hypothetical protein
MLIVYVRQFFKNKKGRELKIPVPGVRFCPSARLNQGVTAKAGLLFCLLKNGATNERFQNSRMNCSARI